MPHLTSAHPSRIARRALACLPAVLFAVTSVAGARVAGAQVTDPSAQPVLVVGGLGVVTAKPDRASLLLTVESRARTAAATGQANARRMRAVTDSLRKLGHGADRISTTGYTIEPQWMHERGVPPRVTGYVARNMIRLRLDDPDAIGAAIDAALGAGADRVESIDFTASNIAALQLAALDSAVANARTRAGVLARAAGGTLGALEVMSTEREDMPDPRRYGRVGNLMSQSVETSAAMTSVTPGELRIAVAVQARWRFVPGTR